MEISIDWNLTKENYQQSRFDLFVSLPVSFIWDFAYKPNQDEIYVATGGEEANIYRIDVIDEKPTFKLVVSFPHSSATKLLFDDEKMVVGTSDDGKLYVIDDIDSSTPNVRAIYDAVGRDIGDFFIDGRFAYVGTAGANPFAGPSSNEGNNFENKNGKSEVQGGQQSSISEGENEDRADLQGGSSPSLVPSLPSSNRIFPQFKNEVSMVDLETGYTKKLASFDNKNILSLGYIDALNHSYGDLPRAGKALYIAFLEMGEIILFDTGNYEMELLHYDEDVGVSAFAKSGEQIFLSSKTGGDIYRLHPNMPSEGRWVSEVYDLGAVKEIGGTYFENYSENKQVRLSIRSGLTKDVSTDWSAWIPLESSDGENEIRLGESDRKLASRGLSRFAQLSMEFEKETTLEKGTAISPKVGFLVFSYAVPNHPPSIEEITLKPNVTPRLQKGLGLDESSSANKLGLLSYLQNKPSIKSYTLSWKSIDPDGDPLRFSIYYKERNQKDWQELSINQYKPFLRFDNGWFVDGFYQFKVVVDDETGNGQKDAYRFEKTSPFHIVDHTSPSISIDRKKGIVSLEVKDELSAIVDLYYSVNSGPFYRVAPDDGVFEEAKETFTLELPSTEQNTLRVIAVDSSGNYASKSIRFD